MKTNKELKPIIEIIVFNENDIVQTSDFTEFKDFDEPSGG